MSKPISTHSILEGMYQHLVTTTKDSIAEFLKTNNISKVDFTLDQYGRRPYEDKWDENWSDCHKITAICNGDNGACEATIVSLELRDQKFAEDQFILTAEHELAGSFEDENIVRTLECYLGILYYLEDKFYH